MAGVISGKINQTKTDKKKINKVKADAMKKTGNFLLDNIRIYRFICAATVLLIIILVWLGLHVWTKYEKDLMSNQKEQLQLITLTLSQSMEATMKTYMDDLEEMAAIEETGGQEEEDLAYYKTYLNTHNSFVYDLRWEKEDGEIIESVMQEELSDRVFITQATEEIAIYQCTDSNGNFYMELRTKLQNHDDTWLCLVVNSQSFYENLISTIHVGTNGYIVVKNSDGLLIMHPSYEQWGIDVIEGRMELFPDKDYTSLENMINKQIEEDSGVYEYTSYWWTDEDVPEVKKIASHNHCKVGDDFWIISAVVDYSDFYEPIRDGFMDILWVFAGILTVVILMALITGYLTLSNIKSREEVAYLRSLNETLEKLHKSEEAISHQQRLQVIGAMTSGIVHEFNNFLTPIVGYADLLALDLEEGSEDYEYVREISEAADKARDMIRQIASMSRKNVETVYQPIVASKMMTRVMKMVTTVCPPNVKLESSILLGEEELIGNVTQINEVILNICVNGIHAIGHEEGTLSVASEIIDQKQAEEIDPHEQISEQWKQYMHISITDTGSGIDPVVMPHIFEPFFTTKSAGQGTGLGLSMADQIIRYHRGYIFAESKVGEGTAFHILLPVIEAGTEEDNTVLQKNDYTIAAADDNPKILSMLEKDFAKLDVKILACSGKEALDQILKTSNIQILAVDETLSDGFGIEYCMSIQGKYPNLVKILMTDRLTREVLEAKQHGIISNYVTKPVSTSSLLAAVRETGI